jgi:flavodoxin
MAKAIIVYESKYGNTRLVAGTIGEEIRRVPGNEVVLTEVGEADLKRMDGFDTILLGCPTHFGRPTRDTRRFIDKLGKLGLREKRGAVFDTYLGADFEKAVKKLEKQITEKVPGLRLMAPGLSVRVDGMKGPITEGELPKCKEFGANIAALMRD